MTDERLLKAMFDHRDVWKYADENKFLKVYPRPMVAMLDAAERELNRLREKCGEPVRERD